MASDLQVATGNYGRWRGLMELISQNEAANTSYIRVRGIVYNDGISTSYNNNGVAVSLTAGLSYSASPAMSVPAGGSQTLIDRYFTINHDASGNGSAACAVNLGATGTSNIGGPATVSISLGFARLTHLASAPGNPSFSALSTSGATATWTDPADWGRDDTSDFKIQIATNSGFSGATEYTVTNANSRIFTGLAQYTTYYIRVRATTIAGDGAWSNTMSFQTLAAAPTAPGTPTLSRATTGTSLTADWTDPASWGGNDTSTFKVLVATNSGFTGATEYLVTGNSKTITGLVPGQIYYVKVLAYNAGGDGVYSAASNITMYDYATAPGLPTISGITGSGFTGTWSTPSSNGGVAITGYQIERALNSGFTGATVFNEGTSLSKVFTGLAGNTTYYMRVRALTSVGYGAWSGTASVTTYTVPNAPVAPTAGTITATSIQVNYVESTSNGGSPITGHDIQIATDAGFTTPTTVALGATTYTNLFTGLDPNVAYYFRVRSKNAVGPGEWSPTLTTATLAALYIKKSGTWRSVVKVFIKKSGTWHEVTDTYVKKSGTWH